MLNKWTSWNTKAVFHMTKATPTKAKDLFSTAVLYSFNMIHRHQCNKSPERATLLHSLYSELRFGWLPPSRSTFRNLWGIAAFLVRDSSLAPLTVHLKSVFFPQTAYLQLGTTCSPSSNQWNYWHKCLIGEIFNYVLIQVGLFSRKSPNEQCILFTLPAWEQSWHKNE